MAGRADLLPLLAGTESGVQLSRCGGAGVTLKILRTLITLITLKTLITLITLINFLNVICLNGWPNKHKALIGRMINWM
jgi:hypothetical protein